MYLCLLEHANTKKDVYEHSCSSVRAFLSILAHSAHLACFFSLILNRIKKMFWFKHTNTRKHVSEQSWLSGWIILNISAHLAHLAQSYYSLIFSTTNANNCFWFDLTNKKNSVTEDKSMVKSHQCLWLFSSRRQPPLLVKKQFGFDDIYFRPCSKDHIFVKKSWEPHIIKCINTIFQELFSEFNYLYNFLIYAIM